MARRLERGSRLVLASHNRGKLAEFAELVRSLDIELVSAGAMGLPEPEETAPDFYGNARLKAEAASQASGLPSLADDSGFCVAALDGAPGVYSARWAGPEKDFAAAMARVERERADATETRAWFVCVLSMAWPDGEAASFMGRVEGNMVWPPRGTAGFGYDAMFVPLGGVLTYAEMAPAEKNAGSHRAHAMAQLVHGCF